MGGRIDTFGRGRDGHGGRDRHGGDGYGGDDGRPADGPPPTRRWAVGWARMAKDERRRAATLAAQTHDRPVLLGLADSWYVLYGRGGAAVSANTRATCRAQLTQVLDALAQENLLHPGRETVNTWVRRLHERGVAPSTIQVRRAAGRCLYRALRWAGATDDDPFADVRTARDPIPAWEKRHPYPEHDLKRLLAQARREGSPADEAILLLGGRAGLRVSEMAALRWADVDLADAALVVRPGKGGAVRTVLLSPALVRALRALAAAPDASGFVLPCRGRTTIWRRVAGLCRRADVRPHDVHSLRHTAGTRIVADTGTLEDAARQLGHTSIDTTRVYAKWQDRRLKDAIAALDD